MKTEIFKDLQIFLYLLNTVKICKKAQNSSADLWQFVQSKKHCHKIEVNLLIFNM